MEDVISEIKRAIADHKAVIGTKETMAGLKLGRMRKVLITSNCPEKVRKDVVYYGRLAGCAVEPISMPNDELGVLCRKPFSISVLGLRE